MLMERWRFVLRSLRLLVMTSNVNRAEDLSEEDQERFRGLMVLRLERIATVWHQRQELLQKNAEALFEGFLQQMVQWTNVQNRIHRCVRSFFLLSLSLSLSFSLPLSLSLDLSLSLAFIHLQEVPPNFAQAILT